MDTKGERRGWEELRDWDGHVYTTDNYIQNRELMRTYCRAQGTPLNALR